MEYRPQRQHGDGLDNSSRSVLDSIPYIPPGMAAVPISLDVLSSTACYLIVLCREGLNSLVALGFHFKVLQDYVEQETSLLPGQRQSSLIRRAIATGLSGTILSGQCIPQLCSPLHSLMTHLPL